MSADTATPECVAIHPCGGTGPCGGDGCAAEVVAFSPELDGPELATVAELPPAPFLAATCGGCNGLGVIVDAGLTEQLRSQTGRSLTVTERCGICGGSGGLIGPR